MAKEVEYVIDISANSNKNPNHVAQGSKPDHWVDKAGTAFKNPWKSWRTHTFRDRLNLVPTLMSFPSPPKNIAEIMPIRKPTWGIEPSNSKDTLAENGGKDSIKTTWLGHACFLVELPARLGQEGRGVRILFDPVFSDRCSPSQWIGPKRYTPPPCKIEDIPEIDAVVISHNHYDHLDTHTIRTLLERTSRTPHFFAPLGNGAYFKSLGRLVLTKSDDKKALAIDITCTPGQHFTGRSLTDFFKSLWAGWAVEEVIEGPTESSREATKVYFAGDTGYRAVLDGQNEDEVPVCPAFETIGNKFGGFDVALIPIGLSPRDYMSPIHCAPQDSVRLFKDVKAKKAYLGIDTEDVTEPPRRLAEECKKLG
ncbi:N-acyl-phosphatidylethanolamine-hydrolyzing phospholipase D [Gymnopilus junonius]|uniref:N-acyl-phosphatidylethanolamine-hydrolyzing phospholipase D n=1 Tax=Gymnopilus junonius TaxID=109634 RepID=A0A9P5NQ21_GYMJU|nr:N-acyl-phosphatidylethanolamine-hydrolyzing phospholipase D [Gymnopilus junonius]